MSQSRLAAQLKRLLPGQENTRIRQGIMAAYINNTGSAALNSNQHNHEIGQIYGLPEELESFVKTDGSRDLTAPLVSPYALTDDQLINLGQSKGLFYTKTQMDDFFAGTTPKLGYNKNNWDTAYTRSITGGNFNETTGNLSFTRQGLFGLTINLDGRYIRESEKGIVNGVATLDLNGKVPLSQINDALLGNVSYQGQWNANTNTPALPDPTTVKGHYYVTQTAGTYNGTYYEVGDWAIADGVIWDVVRNTDAVASVFGRTGVITAQPADYAAFYEPIFSKNTAFNKDFGTAAGTVAQGNDSRILNGQTAFGWGNHALAGYLTSADLNGYATESWVTSQGYAVSGTGGGQVRTNTQLDARYQLSGDYVFSRPQISSGNASDGGTMQGVTNYTLFTSSATNLPLAETIWVQTIQNSSVSATSVQIGITQSANRYFFRSGNLSLNPSTSWREMWHSGNLLNPATESWVTSQGYLTNADLAGYATESWVSSQGYALDSAVIHKTGDETKTGILWGASFSPFRIKGTGSGNSNVGYFSIYEIDGATRQAFLGFGSSSTGSLDIRNDVSSTSIRLDEAGGINGLQYSDGISNRTVWHSGNLSTPATQSWVQSGYEPLFSKNTAFNKNFGTTSGTVAQGNDSRILNGQTAFGWGNHALAGYLTSADLNGYATESWVQSQGYTISGTGGSQVRTNTQLDARYQLSGDYVFSRPQISSGNASDGGTMQGVTNYTLFTSSATNLPLAETIWVQTIQNSSVSATSVQIGITQSANRYFFRSGNLSLNPSTSWREMWHSGNLLNPATESWVTSQGYLTSADLAGYATESWVSSQGYALDSAVIHKTGDETKTGILWGASFSPFRIKGTGSGNSNVGYFSIYEIDGATRQAFLGFGSSSTGSLDIRNDVSNTSIRLDEAGGINGLQYSDGISNRTVWHSGNLSTPATQSWVQSGYEPLFSKNTAFNKNFGTTSGTVAQGDDSRILNGQTAFGWGNFRDYGLGYAVVYSGLNTAGQGFFLAPTSATGAPSGAVGNLWGITHIGGSSRRVQEVMSGANYQSWQRYYDGSSWSGWFEKATIGSGSGQVRSNGQLDSRYLQSSDLNGYATQSWVQSQGYVISGTGGSQVRNNSQLDSRYSQVAHNHDSRYGRVDQSADTITNFWRGTQAQWDALGTKPSIAFIKD
ncbi:hypothetical protein DN752_17740 [Echinicola strongylocentroti]|uniref:Uncharacterized protein n=1 Tax=Echinicola strongylocentroti TaxID=1795355 RepID=A0A2Z4ILR6_9BACT|nr:hypothetical protein [Echinicola strongylocentroti]AWW31824.1 hypothetical protein DN752_17740 [Echinicola strongylocentroti]